MVARGDRRRETGCEEVERDRVAAGGRAQQEIRQGEEKEEEEERTGEGTRFLRERPGDRICMAARASERDKFSKATFFRKVSTGSLKFVCLAERNGRQLS